MMPLPDTTHSAASVLRRLRSLQLPYLEIKLTFDFECTASLYGLAPPLGPKCPVAEVSGNHIDL